MKAILVIDVDDDIDVKNTQATYIELKCNNDTRQMSLINHWLKPIPTRVIDKNTFAIENKYMNYQDGYNYCIEKLLREK